jgi:hypothetical protein
MIWHRLWRPAPEPVVTPSVAEYLVYCWNLDSDEEWAIGPFADFDTADAWAEEAKTMWLHVEFDVCHIANGLAISWGKAA